MSLGQSKDGVLERNTRVFVLTVRPGPDGGVHIAYLGIAGTI